MDRKKLKGNIRAQPTIPELNMNDRWAAMLPTVISHIKKQDIQGIMIMEPYITPPYSGKYADGKMSKLDAITDRINACIDYFMEETDATHIWLIDGDIELPKHALRYLINLDVDVASGIYPFHNEKHAMMFGRMKDPSADAKEVEKTNMFTPRGLIGFPGDGIIGGDMRVGGGNGCLLVKRRVFRQWSSFFKPLRFVNNVERLGSDLYFWYRCQELGLSCRIHGRVICGHLPQWPLSCYKEDYEKWGMDVEG